MLSKSAHITIKFFLLFILVSHSACVTKPPLVIEKNKAQTPQWTKRDPDKLFKTKSAVWYLSVHSIRDNLPNALKQAVDDAVEKANKAAMSSDSKGLLIDAFGKESARKQLIVELQDVYYEKVKASKVSKDQLSYYYRIYLLLELSR